MRDGLIRIAREYPDALNRGALKGHPLATFIRQEMRQRLVNLIGPSANSYKIEGSPGQGNWSNSPWLAVFDPLVTDSAMRGYYPVFLFGPEFETVVLMLGQGTYSVRAEYGAAAPGILQTRADVLRGRVPEFPKWFERRPFSVRGSKKSANDWELTSDTFGREYKIASMPSNDELALDLEHMLHFYHAVTSRGGFELDDSDDSDASPDATRTKAWQEGEKRKRIHERFERRRNSALAREVKRAQGCRCQGCGFEFGLVYGTLGEKYIDAHHLVPLSRLGTDGPVPMDPIKDFAVLCANCHRMIHQMGCPPLDEFQRRISARFVALIEALNKPHE